MPEAKSAPDGAVLAEGARKVLADEVAKPFREEIQAAVRALPDGIGPKLVGFLANDDPAARKYAEWTEKAFKSDLLRFELRKVEEHELEDKLQEANDDPDVHGIMIYYPVFGQRPSFHGPSQDDYLRDCISLFKDVEGLCHFYRRSLYRNRRLVDGEDKKCVAPCTPLAVLKVLEHLGTYDHQLAHGDRLRGKTMVVVNRSEVVGRPLAAMLANDGATVYSVDIDSVYRLKRGKLEQTTETVENLVPQADVVILGVPSPSYKLDVNLVKEGAVVLNVASHKNIDEVALLSTVKNVRYMSQIGKVTVAMLERNLLRLHSNFAAEASYAHDADLMAAVLALDAPGAKRRRTMAQEPCRS